MILLLMRDQQDEASTVLWWRVRLVTATTMIVAGSWGKEKSHLFDSLIHSVNLV